jgi:Domain of unknown function (DUF4249)
VKNIPFFLYVSLFSLLISLAACGNLEKEVTLDFPQNAGQLVVESYLVPNQPFQVLITKSNGFFDPLGLTTDFLLKSLEGDAKVSISHNGKVYNLKNQLFVNPTNGLIGNYVATETVPLSYNQDFQLNISTKAGKTITGVTRLLPPVPIDSVVVEFDAVKDTSSRARAFMYYKDDTKTANYYRRILQRMRKGQLRTEQDFVTDDLIFDTEKQAFGSRYGFKNGDTIINTLCNVDRAYYDYFRSVLLAEQANGNPFGQGVPIKSNISGTAEAIGIFTGLSSATKVNIAKKK